MIMNKDMPAMPTPDMDSQHSQVDYGGGRFAQSRGLTKLEHFAGLAMQGLITLKGSDCQNADQTAMQCVRMAKALLAQLDREKGDE